MNVRDWKGTAKMTVKKLSEIIGTTGDTGGTATAGTLMAKVNEIIGKAAKEKTAKEILEEFGNFDTLLTSVSPGSAKTTTVLSVTGKGKLHRLFASDYGNNSGNMVITIIVDGVSYKVTVGVSNSPKYRRLLVCKQSDMFFDGSSVIAGNCKMSSKIDDIVNIFDNPSLTGGIDNRAVWCRLTEAISFEQSLTVTFKTIGTSNTCKVEYTLDEE